MGKLKGNALFNEFNLSEKIKKILKLETKVYLVYPLE